MVDSNNIIFKFKLRKACCGKFQKLKVAFGEQAVGRLKVFWDVFPKFRSRVTSVEDAKC
jgi:hypothetical protein